MTVIAILKRLEFAGYVIMIRIDCMLRRYIWVCLAATFTVVAAFAQDLSIAIPDVAVLNQRGEAARINTDVIANHVVVVNFIFTTCGTICPPMGANFGRLEKLLEERGESRVQLVSISIDPQTDTPERLREWAGRFHAGSQWTLLTGSKRSIEQILRAFGVFTPDKLSHTPILMIGNSRGWVRADALKTAPARVAEIATALANAAEVGQR